MGFGGSYAHARAFYRAAVEALALAVPLSVAGSGGGSGGADGPEASESSTARVLRGWALMESDLRYCAIPWSNPRDQAQGLGLPPRCVGGKRRGWEWIAYGNIYGNAP